MTPSAADNQLPPDKLPVLIATASILQISESMLPHPLPGLRFGLANIVSLIVLYRYGFRPALTITLMRTVVTAFIMGSFLSPGFALSFAGGCTSMCVMGLLHRISTRIPRLGLSPMGLGMAGAFVHNMVQLGLAYLLLIRHPGIFFLVPWLSFGSVILGSLSGGLAAAVLTRLDRGTVRIDLAKPTVAPIEDRVYQAGNSWLHRCPATVKITAVLGLTLTTVCVENLYLYAALFAGLLSIPALASLSYARVLGVLWRLRFVMLSAALLPLWFNAGSRELINTPVGTLHLEAVVSAAVFGGRIALLALLSTLVARTTPATDFTKGLRTCIRPLDRLGFNSDAFAETLSRSLAALPEVWIEIRSLLSALVAGKRRDLATLKTAVIQVFLHLFAATDRP